MNHPVFLNVLLIVTTLALAIAFITYQIPKADWLQHH